MSTNWIFGYASLVTDAAGAGRPAVLRGYRRFWGVATDNVRSIPGYKLYLLRSDGSRPAVSVAFLDIEPDPGARVTGVVMPVTEAELGPLDRRERNYDRIDVTHAIEPVPGGRVWTYRGSVEGRERLRGAHEAGTAVISRDYREHVRAGFRALGAEQLREYEVSADAGELSIWDLDRVDLPVDSHPPVPR